MNNSTLSCLDRDLSHYFVTIDYWQVSPALTSLGIVTGSFLLLFILLALPSNLLIILCILLKKLYKQPTYLLLLSLSISDLLMCVIVMPLIVVSGLAGEFVLGHSDWVRCKVCQTGVCLIASTLSSLHLLALISVDRFIFIKYPLRYNSIVTPGKTMALVLTVCGLSCCLAVLPLFGFGDIHFDHETFSCSPRFDHHTDVTLNIHYMILVILEAMLSIIVLVVTNVWVLCIARRQIYRNIKSFTNVEQATSYQRHLRTTLHQEKYRKQLQLLRVFGAIFISHMITWILVIVRVFEVLVGAQTSSQSGATASSSLPLPLTLYCTL